MNYWRMFDLTWFAGHQRGLLWLLNHWLTRRWFRWVLRIRRCDVGYRAPISELFPHAYTVANLDGTRTTDFRTHAKYAKRVYFAFWAVWWWCHIWDSIFADRWCLNLSTGFKVLTVYPDPGDPGIRTLDGQVGRLPASETFSAIRNGSGNDHNSSSTQLEARLRASSTTNEFDILRRQILLFYTHGVGVIDSAVLSLNGAVKENALGETSIHIAGATPASDIALVDADYGQCQTVSFGSMSYTAWAINSYNDIPLNASGLASISPNVTKFSAQLQWDLDDNFGGVWVSAGQTSLRPYAADQGGLSFDPKLVVTYRGQNGFQQQVLKPSVFVPGLAQ